MNIKTLLNATAISLGALLSGCNGEYLELSTSTSSFSSSSSPTLYPANWTIQSQTLTSWSFTIRDEVTDFDASIAFISDDDTNLYKIDLQAAEILNSGYLQNSADQLLLTKDKSIVVVASQGSSEIVLVSAETLETIDSFEASHPVNDIALTSDDLLIVSYQSPYDTLDTFTLNGLKTSSKMVFPNAYLTPFHPYSTLKEDRIFLSYNEKDLGLFGFSISESKLNIEVITPRRDTTDWRGEYTFEYEPRYPGDYHLAIKKVLIPFNNKNVLLSENGCAYLQSNYVRCAPTGDLNLQQATTRNLPNWPTEEIVARSGEMFYEMSYWEYGGPMGYRMEATISSMKIPNLEYLFATKEGVMAFINDNGERSLIKLINPREASSSSQNYASSSASHSSYSEVP